MGQIGKPRVAGRSLAQLDKTQCTTTRDANLRHNFTSNTLPNQKDSCVFPGNPLLAL